MKYFLPALTLLLIGLKLTGHINDWSWWWVWSPIWVPVSVLGGLSVFFGLVGIVVRWLETPAERKSRELQEALKNYADALTRKK
jgi:hypothetical protein